jgi:predicted ArsR family transcriptional regulator
VVVDQTRTSLAKALAAILECREQVRTGETALWLNAAYARRLGASVAQIATAAGVSTDTARERLRKLEGRG